MTPMKYPVGIEYAYRVLLLGLVNQVKQLLKKHMSPIVPKMVKEVHDTSYIRQDAWRDDLERILNRIADEMMTAEDKLIRETSSIAARTEQFNRGEWQRLIRSQYGVDPTSEDPDLWRTVLTNFAHDNARLIKDIPAKMLRDIRDLTIEALQSGKSIEDMQSDVFDIMSDRSEVTDSRAELIARDQIAKLNGEFTQERQRNLGVEYYIWRTVGDERVRETHDACDGRTFSWDMPPGETDGNHPGEDYQCRCWAEPILPEVMEFEASLMEAEE